MMLKMTNKNILLLIIAVLISVIGSAQTEPYEDLLEHRSGFAESVTGGQGGEVVTITATGDAGFNQLRSALSGDQAKWIRFSPGLSGEILINNSLNIGSNKTIDGRGANITFKGKYTDDVIYIWGDTNIIIHNIRFFEIGVGDDNGQALGLADGADLIWLDHVTFEHNGDESLSIGGYESEYKYGYNSRVTASYCKWYNTVKCMLIGNSEIDGEGFKLTVHHSFFEGGPDVGVSRIPLLRHAKIHFFNNYVLDVGWQAAAIHEDGEALLEYNIYDTQDDDVMNCGTDQWDPEPGWICDIGNDLRRGAYRTGPESGYDCSKVFFASSYYDYELEVNLDSVESFAKAFSGRSDDPVWIEESTPKPFILTVEQVGDGNVSVFPERDFYYRGEPVGLLGDVSGLGLGHAFSHWSGDISGTDNPITIIMDTNKQVLANFKEIPVYHLITTTVGEGRVSSMGNGDYNEGTEVKIIAFPTWGYEFLRWEGDYSGTESTINISVDSTMHIIAVFSGDPDAIAEDLIVKYDLKTYPNPFTTQSTFSYQLKQTEDVQIAVYNLAGEKIVVLVNQKQVAGKHQIVLDGSKLKPGIYFYTFSVASDHISNKILLIK